MPGRTSGRRRAPWIPYFVFGVALTITVLVWAYADRVGRSRDSLVFRTGVLEVKGSLDSLLRDRLAFLRSAAGLFAGNRDGVTRKEFALFEERSGIAQDHPSIQGLGYAPAVAPEQVAALTASARREGIRGFHVWPSPNRPLMAPILYFDPPGKGSAIGYDMFSDPERRAAMERARDEAEPAMTDAVVLQGDPHDGRAAFLIYDPVYRGGVVPPTVEERRRKLAGFVYMPFRSDHFFASVFPSGILRSIQVEVYDVSASGKGPLLFRSGPLRKRPVHVQEEGLAVAGHAWNLRFFSTREFEGAASLAMIRWIPVVGVVIGGLLFALTMSQYRARESLEVHTELLAKREASQRLLADVGAILSTSLDLETTLKRLAETIVPSFADWCAIHLREPDGAVKRVTVTHRDPAKVRWANELAARYAASPTGGEAVAKVMSTGQPLLLPHITDEMLAAIARDEEHLRALRELGLSSALIVPMPARGRTLGALSLVWAESGRVFGPEDLGTLEDLGARAGIAIDNVRLYQALSEELEERRRAEERIRQLNEDLERLVLERTQELQASNQELEAFCYSVSHDLRSPLRSVDGFSKALLDDYGDRLDEAGQDYLNRVRAAAKRMDELITTLLNLSRLTRAEIRRTAVDVSQAARDVARESAATEAGSRVEFRIADGLQAYADARMVAVVLDNLIGNAVKFSGPVAEPCVEVGAANGAFYVRDNGVGFNPAYAAKLFAPFERLHTPREFPGTGIGLATVDRIVRRHGGRIWAESAEGKGATFWFTLGDSPAEG